MLRLQVVPSIGRVCKHGTGIHNRFLKLGVQTALAKNYLPLVHFFYQVVVKERHNNSDDPLLKKQRIVTVVV